MKESGEVFNILSDPTSIPATAHSVSILLKCLTLALHEVEDLSAERDNLRQEVERLGIANRASLSTKTV